MAVTDKIPIITCTRDRPDGLRHTLQSILNDINDSPRAFNPIIIDDSSNEVNRQLNKATIDNLSGKNKAVITYFGIDEYDHLSASLRQDVKPTFLRLTKRLGASFYDSIGPRNLGLFLAYGSPVIFIIDDDVVISDPQIDKAGSVIEKMITELGSVGIVGVRWAGIPDQSTLEHLDDHIQSQLSGGILLPPTYDFPFREPINPRSLGWRRVPPEYVTSGGGMAFRGELALVQFPNIFNDDWHWISYHYWRNKTKVSVLDGVTFLNKPPGWRMPTRDTLVREMMGEIIFEAVHRECVENGENGWYNLPENRLRDVTNAYIRFMELVYADVVRLVAQDCIAVQGSPFKRYCELGDGIRNAMDELKSISNEVFYRNLKTYLADIAAWRRLVMSKDNGYTR